jgi:hypothetical protein
MKQHNTYVLGEPLVATAWSVLRWRWREAGSVIYCCWWASQAQSCSGLNPTGLRTIFYCPNSWDSNLEGQVSIRRLSRLAGLWWRYSIPPLHGKRIGVSSDKRLYTEWGFGGRGIHCAGLLDDTGAELLEWWPSPAAAILTTYLRFKIGRKEDETNWTVKHNLCCWMSNKPRFNIWFF